MCTQKYILVCFFFMHTCFVGYMSDRKMYVCATGGDGMGWSSNVRSHHHHQAPQQQTHGLGLTRGHATHAAPSALRPGALGNDGVLEQMQILHGGVPPGNGRGMNTIEHMQLSGNDAFNSIFGGGKDWHTTHKLASHDDNDEH